MPDNNASGQESSGTTRRAFLGAASAAAALAATGTGTATDDQDTSEGLTDLDELAFSAGVQLRNQYDNPADYELIPSQLADERVAVSLRIKFDVAELSLAFTTEEAEAFIDRFETAVERGDKGLGKREQ